MSDPIPIFSQYLPRVELLAGEKEFAPGTR